MSVELDDLYSEFRVEEQDLRILKAITTDNSACKDFTGSYDHTLFLGDSQDFAEMTLNHLKTYGSPPSRRVLLETNGDKAELINYVYDELDRLNFDKNDFKYDLQKIKSRFTRRKAQSLREALDDIDFSKDSADDELRNIKYEFEKLQQVRSGKRKTYKQYTLAEYLPTFQQDYFRKSQDENLGQGILTGYGFLDYVKNGMQPAELLIIGGETGAGKAQTLNTLIPTPDGFKEHGKLKPGDKIFGKDGKTYNVVAESKIYNDPGWKFVFNDGSEVISHDNHEWLTFDRKEQVALCVRTPEYRAKRRARRKSRAIKNTKPWLSESNKNRKYDLLQPPTGTIRTSKEIAETLFVHKNKRRNHAIPLAEPIELPEKDLLIDPYLFGCWLGDGTSRDGQITTMDEEIVETIKLSRYRLGAICTKTDKDGNLSKASSYRLLGLRSDLNKLGVLKNKHIPHDYLWSAKKQRLALLQGLMDTDGYISKKGQIDFVNTNQKIAEGVAHLVRSLGEKCTITEGEVKINGKVTGPKWIVRFSPSFDAFRLKRKLERQAKSPRLNKFRYIVDAIRIPAVPMKCIQVDSPDHLYLCTENFIPTHNSMLLNNMATQMWMQKNDIHRRRPEDIKPGHNVLYFSLEMPYEMCFRRTMARLADVPIYGLRDCKLGKSLINNLDAAANFIDSFGSQFEIVDVPRGVNVAQIEERFNEACAKGHRPEVVVVDYLGLMEDDDNNADDWLKLGAIAGKLHEFARVYEVAVLTAVQLNRPPKSANKDSADLIGLHRIGRSSLIMHHADLGIQIESRKDEHTYADMIYHIIKNRDGELGKQTLLKNFANATVIENPESPFIKPSLDDIGSFTSVNVQDDISNYLKSIGWAK